MNRTSKMTAAVGAFGLAILLVAALSGAEEPKQPAATQPKAAPTAPAIDPEAVAAVERMGAYLKTLPAYSVRAETATDEVLLAGPKVQYGGAIDATYRAPDGLWMRVVRDEKDDQQFFLRREVPVALDRSEAVLGERGHDGHAARDDHARRIEVRRELSPR